MDITGGNLKTPKGIRAKNVLSSQSGRFCANLLVSDDVLDDGRIRVSSGGKSGHTGESESTTHTTQKEQTLFSQSVANYVIGKLKDLRDIIQILANQPKLFGSVMPVIIEQMRQDLSQDQLWQNFWQERISRLPEAQQRTFPFGIFAKASKAEKNRGLGVRNPEQVTDGRSISPDYPSQRGQTQRQNPHPTCKPLKLMSYLITLGSREGDTVLDPFVGSGSTLVAAKMLNRKSIGFDTYEPYCEISAKRCEATIPQMVMEPSIDQF